MTGSRTFRRTRTDRSSAAGDEARARILAAASELMAEKGYRGTSVAQVAASAQISQAGLLHHFPTKAALLVALLSSRDDLTEGAVHPDGQQLSGWAALDSLASVVEENARHADEVRLFVTLSAEAMDPEHPGHAWATQRYATIQDWLSAALRLGIQDGAMSAELPVETVVRLTISLMDGLQLQWLASGCRLDMAAEFRAYTAILEQVWGVDRPG